MAAESIPDGAHLSQPDVKSKPGRSAPVLPWMRVPLTIDPGDGTLLEEVGGLDSRLTSALNSSGIEVLFPVQTAVWEATAGGLSTLHDVCLAAPTGSGKTLAYSLPVLQALSSRPLSGLQALIMLPTRDLAMQVFSVISPLCEALGLSCCAACGKAGLAAEAAALAGGLMSVVVATPGRLIAHLEGTPGFTLGSLRFLIVDEADRLLRQTYQSWLPRVLSASSSNGDAPQNTKIAGRVVKFIVSATLTKDPSKLDRLGLYCPRYIAMTSDDHRYKLPSGLQELKFVVPAERKPYALAALLADQRPAPTIVFASAVESTRRIALLLRALRDVVGEAVEYSAALPPEERRAALASFRDRKASILVCSDAMTRGMDVEGVEVVINYDAPVYVKTYVHRAGRTARAGKSGKVVTLLRNEDVRHFKSMLRKADNTYVKDAVVQKERMEEVKAPVSEALAAMAEALQKEGHGYGGSNIKGVVVVQQQQPQKKKRSNPVEGKLESKKPAKRRKLIGIPELNLRIGI